MEDAHNKAHASGIPRGPRDADADQLLEAVPMRYHRSMDDTADRATNAAPAGWLEALARSEADRAAGRLVPGEAVMRRLRQTIAEMEAEEAKLAARPGKAAPGVDL